ncbi:RNA polymerase sigma-70 factor [Parabacteroides sp. OttesenSCG-928-G06]|nr:RNA polymerase sigma-70 factor [Parabacteroides sp. OttesenSCG-928-K15]MDL2282150.1 RNA polymerase sigma-70 factor [Parabacteroides sp. OttesenSCG-928-G06]
MKENKLQHFEYLFRQLQPRLFAYCCKYVDDKELARDIVQDSFINLWENYEAVNTSFDYYLFKAVRNRCISHFRSLKTHADYEELVHLRIKEIEIHPELNTPLVDFYLHEVEKLLQQSMEKLPQKCRHIFVLSRMQGKKNQEIADQLNISIRTVEAQLYHALKILKAELKDYLSF